MVNLKLWRNQMLKCTSTDVVGYFDVAVGTRLFIPHWPWNSWKKKSTSIKTSDCFTKSPGLDGTDQWCFHCYHVGGECGQGLFYNLFYLADPVFYNALAAEAGSVRPVGVMVDGCQWLHENSVRVRGFPTVPRPCGDFVEEGRCKEQPGSQQNEKVWFVDTW